MNFDNDEDIMKAINSRAGDNDLDDELEALENEIDGGKKKDKKKKKKEGMNYLYLISPKKKKKERKEKIR